jgi:hypothetical protein
MNNPPFGPFDKLMVLSLSKDFDCGLFRPPLRASLESLDSARDPELVEGRVRKHPVETRHQDLQFVAGAYSRILKIRE